MTLSECFLVGADQYGGFILEHPFSVPSAPVGPVATPYDDQASVAFAPPVSDGGSTDAYLVTATDQTDNGRGGQTQSGTSSPIMVSGLTNGDSYTFSVTAVNSIGMGAPSGPSAAVVPLAVPSQPFDLTAVANSDTAAEIGSATVTFSPPVVAGGSPVTSYTVTATDQADPADGGQTATSSSIPVVISGLTEGQSYSFTAVATNALGSGPPSSPSSPITVLTVPWAPRVADPQPGDKTLTLSIAPIGPEDAAPTYYQASIVDLDDPAVTVPSIVATTTVLPVTGLTNGSNYGITVNACNLAGCSSPSDVVDGVPAATPGAPWMAVEVGVDQATVTFSEPDDGGAAIWEYTLEAADLTDPTNPAQTIYGFASPLALTGLTGGDEYAFSLSATNETGTGPRATVDGTPYSTAGAPRSVSAVPGNARATVSFLAPSSDHGAAVTGYSVTATDQTSPGRSPITTTGTTSPISVGGLVNGDRYTFTVVATNLAGAGPASNPSSPVTPYTVPGRPGGVVAAAGDSRATVTFTPATSGGSAIIGYAVQAEDLTNPAHGGQGVFAASSPATITGLTDGDRYTFVVAGYNQAGLGPVSAPTSAVMPELAGHVGCTATLPAGTVVGMAETSDGNGYWIASSTGTVAACGDAPFFGNGPSGVAAITSAPVGNGYWLVTKSGAIRAYGSAINHGGLAATTRLAKPIVAMAADPATGGYWLLGGDGGVFSFDAPFYGSTGSIRLTAPAIGIEATPDGRGYRFVASDGGIFDFGTAPFYGSTGGVRLAQPIVGMADDATSGGYWLVASDGGIFSFHAPFLGSTATDVAGPTAGLSAIPSGAGYRLVTANGHVSSFGRANNEGSAGT
ncbi:MAG TPA: fibronectin type III domain-containing protein [Acidimicrobiales bacterium]|nr:fibronectin type III domain-containing protein [Acidimicrobiales bacterium]